MQKHHARKQIRKFDAKVGFYVNKLPRSLDTFMRSFTFLGNPGPFMMVWAALVVFGFMMDSKQILILALVAILSILLILLLKRIIKRSRPKTAYVIEANLKDFSFPSGHSGGSLAIYGAWGLTVVLLINPLTWWAYVLMGIFFLVPFIVGVSRVYLGAHFPADVIMGWLISGVGLYISYCLVGL